MENLYFENHHQNYYKGEHKFTLYAAFSDDPLKKVIGYLQYTETDDVIHIDYVEVSEQLRKKGIGKSLYKKLYELNPNSLFKRAGYYTEKGFTIRTWFEETVLKPHNLMK